MTLIVDSGPLVALADRRDVARHAVRQVLLQENGALIVPAPVTAEVDYLLGKRLGRPARLAFLEDLAAGRFTVAALATEDHRTIVRLERAFGDLDAGVADLSVVVLANRYQATRPLTFDERHFRALRSLGGEPFVLLPADADWHPT